MLRSGDVVAVDLGAPAGSEAGLARPTVVVTAQRVLARSPNVVHVVPLTGTLRGYEAEILVRADKSNGLAQDSAAQCQHIRAVSVARLGEARGNVGAVVLAQIRQALAILLDVP